MVGGGFRVVKDVPPYILVGGEPLKYNGLNSLGLRRRGFKPEIRKILKETYKYIYNSNMNTNDAINKILLKNYCNKLEVQKIISFIKNSTRGLV